MRDLTTQIVPHYRRREVQCCLCGGLWEEQFVAVALVAGEDVIGSLCPRCLSRTPAEVGADFQEAGNRLRRALNNLNQSLVACRTEPPPAGADAVRVGLAHLREEMDRLRSLWRQASMRYAELQMRWRETREEPSELQTPLRQTPEHSAELLAMRKAASSALRRSFTDLAQELPESEGEAENLLRFAEQLAKLDRWPTTINSLMETERSAIRQRLTISEQDLKRGVDNRYRDFLAASA